MGTTPSGNRNGVRPPWRGSSGESAWGDLGPAAHEAPQCPDRRGDRQTDPIPPAPSRAGRLSVRPQRRLSHREWRGTESANKCICHVRLKRSGGWWYVENANHMLALRCVKYKRTFDRVLEAYREQAKHTPTM